MCVCLRFFLLAFRSETGLLVIVLKLSDSNHTLLKAAEVYFHCKPFVSFFHSSRPSSSRSFSLFAECFHFWPSEKVSRKIGELSFRWKPPELKTPHTHDECSKHSNNKWNSNRTLHHWKKVYEARFYAGRAHTQNLSPALCFFLCFTLFPSLPLSRSFSPSRSLSQSFSFTAISKWSNIRLLFAWAHRQKYTLTHTPTTISNDIFVHYANCMLKNMNALSQCQGDKPTAKIVKSGRASEWMSVFSEDFKRRQAKKKRNDNGDKILCIFPIHSVWYCYYYCCEWMS